MEVNIGSAIGLLLAFITSIYIYLTWTFNYWSKRGVKGPKPKIIYGNVESSIKMKQHLCTKFDYIYRKYKNSEKFVGVFIGRCPQLLLIDPNVVRDVLISNFKNFHDNEISTITTDKLDPLIARNPFLSTGFAWKEKRTEIIPALTATRIKANYPVMRNVAKRVTQFLEERKEYVSKDGLDARELANRFTTDVVANCIYGLEAGAFEQDQNCRIFEEGNSFTLFAMPYYFLIAQFPFLRYFYKIKIVNARSEAFFQKLTMDAMKLKNQQKDDRVDLLNYLIQLKDKKKFSDTDIAAHALTFFLDAFDTSALVISHCMHMLASYKNVQDKLRSEITEAMSPNNNINFENLIDLPYLDQVFCETLRLFPPLTVITKLCTHTHKFTNFNEKSVQIEKGTVMIVPIYSIHRDERYYQEPNCFIPERFNPERGGVKKFRDMGVFIPFGDGPRICLGMKFGLAQAKNIIAELIYNWEMSVHERTTTNLEPDPTNFMYIIKDGVWLNFQKLREDNRLLN